MLFDGLCASLAGATARTCLVMGFFWPSSERTHRRVYVQLHEDNVVTWHSPQMASPFLN